MLKIGLIMVLPVLIAIYTMSFGRYTWRQGNKAGAFGVYFLACGSVFIPLVVLLINKLYST